MENFVDNVQNPVILWIDSLFLRGVRRGTVSLFSCLWSEDFLPPIAFLYVLL